MPLYRLIRNEDGYIHGRKKRFAKDSFHPLEGRYYTERALKAILAGDSKLRETCSVEINYLEPLDTVSVETFFKG